MTNKIQAWAQDNINDDSLVPSLEAETELIPGDISLDLFNAIENLAPFGMGNPKPVFISRRLSVASVIPIGKQQQHIKLLLKSDDQIIEGLFFNASDYVKRLHINDTVNIAYQIDLNEWNGGKKIQLLIKDVRLD